MAIPSNTNIIVDSLPAYVKNNAEIVSKQLAYGPKTLDRVMHQTGVKYKALINLLNVSSSIQDGLGCGYNASGSATLSKREIVTAVMKKEITVCPDTLIGYWPEYMVAIPADKRDSLPFEAYLVSLLIDETNDQLETLIWQGKTSAYSGTDLINGFLTIVNAEATAVKINIANPSSHYSAIKQVIKAAPVKLQREGLKVFVSEDFFQGLCFELVDLNLYHFKPEESLDSIFFPGTKVEIYSTAGLNNSGKIFASVRKNMYYGTDEDDAERRVKVVYDEKDDAFYIKFRWNSGVQVAFPDWCVLATIPTNAIVTNDSAASIAAIAGSVATIATKQASIDTAATKLAGAVNSDNQIETHTNA